MAAVRLWPDTMLVSQYDGPGSSDCNRISIQLASLFAIKIIVEPGLDSVIRQLKVNCQLESHLRVASSGIAVTHCASAVCPFGCPLAGRYTCEFDATRELWHPPLRVLDNRHSSRQRQPTMGAVPPNKSANLTDVHGTHLITLLGMGEVPGGSLSRSRSLPPRRSENSRVPSLSHRIGDTFVA